MTIESVLSYDKPHFAALEAHPFETIEWEIRECGTPEEPKIKVECPSHWSQTACDIATSRYLRRGDIPEWKGYSYLGRDIVPPIQDGRETSIKQLIHRVASFLKDNVQALTTSTEKTNYYLDLCYLLVNQYIGFNTPAWINGGLYSVYGIEGSNRTRWWFDPDKSKVVEINHEQIRPGMAACYLTKVEDTLHGPHSMYDYVLAESRIFTMGAGNGANISNIRSKGEYISGGGIAEGIIPFLKIPDVSAAYIKSGGVSRRAARMLVCDDDHPDIVDFIDWKVNEEEKVVAMAEGFLERYRMELRSQGVKGKALKEKLSEKWSELIDYRGDMYGTVSGQQANNSVRISDKFLRAVEQDGDWTLVGRKDPTITKTVKARYIWDKICLNAWKTGDPGVFYKDTIEKWNTVPHVGECRTTNPCGEITQPDYTSCNLCSMNMVSVLEQMTIEQMIDMAKIITMSLETITSQCSSPSEQHAETTYKLRPLGANIGNIGAALMRNGLPYDSDDGRKLVENFVALFTAACWQASSEIAAKLGTYESYDETNHYRIIEMHSKAANKCKSKLDTRTHLNEYVKNLKSFTTLIYEDLLARRPGFRNDAVTCMVPTGTIGIVMDFDTYGIEPEFSLMKAKQLSEGGWISIANKSVGHALGRMGYKPELIPGLVEEIVAKRTVTGVVSPEDESVFDCAQKCSGGRSIRVRGHVDMMAVIQPHISMAQSKTVNLPNSATIEDISEVYLYGWKRGLKNVALYRDGCKLSQPLSADLGTTTEIVEEETDIDIESLLNRLRNAEEIVSE